MVARAAVIVAAASLAQDELFLQKPLGFGCKAGAGQAFVVIATANEDIASAVQETKGNETEKTQSPSTVGLPWNNRI